MPQNYHWWKKHRSYFQSCYCRYQSESCIISRWLQYRRYELNRQEKNGNIIISDTKLRNILPPKVKNTTYRYKVMCGCECCITAKSLHSYLLTWNGRHMKHLKEKSKTRKTGGLENYQVVSMKHIKMQWNCMADTFIVLLYIWLWQKCVLASQKIMDYHTGNLYYDVVRNDQV